MKTITKKYNIYTFDELDEETQKRLIEEEKQEEQSSYCDCCLYEDMKEEAQRLIKEKLNIEPKEINVYYSLSYCQGDGSMIEFNITLEEFSELAKKYKILNKDQLNFIKNYPLIDEIKIYHDSSLYYHEYTFNIKYYDNFNYWSYEDIKDYIKISKKDFEEIEDKIINLLDSYNKHNTKSPLIEDIININKELTKTGYNLIENCITDETAKENLKEKLFFKDGAIFQ